MTRRGKIARLPNVIRQELNQRLRDGERLDKLAKWLNSLPRVKAIMESEFEGKAVSAQNVSDWRKAGYLDWLRDEEAKSWLAELKGGAEVLEKAVDGVEISKLFSARLAVEMTRLAQALMDKESEPEKRWKRVCAVHKEVSRMRRDDMWNTRTQVWQERWQQEQKELGQAEELEDRPGNWMTPEERAAQQRRILGCPEPEDYEILKAGRRRLLSPKEKKQYVADRMYVSEKEEKEGLKWHEYRELTRKTYEAQKAAVTAWLERENSVRKSQGAPAYASLLKEDMPSVEGRKGAGEEDGGWASQARHESVAPQETFAARTVVKVEDGGVAKHPTSKHQSPEKRQAPNTKVVVGQGVEDGEEKSAPTNVGDYEEKGDGAQGTARPTNEGLVGRAVKIEDEKAGAENRPISTDSDPFRPVERVNESATKLPAQAGRNTRAALCPVLEKDPTLKEWYKTHTNPPPGLWKLKSPNFNPQGSA